MNVFLRPTILFLLFGVALQGGTPAVEEIIARARATVGSEAAIRGLVTLQLEGRVEPALPGQPEGNIRIILRRPNAYRSTVLTEELAEHTIVEGRRGCMIRRNRELNESRMRALTGEEIHRISITADNWFNPYRIDSPADGEIHYIGIEDRRGRRCHHLRYSYKDGIVVDRYFAVGDGNLVATVNDLDVESVEIGQRTAGGMNFPEKVEYYENNEKLHTVVFTRIAVNKPLPAGVFAIPE